MYNAFFAVAPRFMETLLADELRGLGLEDVAETRSGAAFGGTLETAYRVCLWSRIAMRVLLPIAEFDAADAAALYEGAAAIDWSEHLDCDRTLAVHLDIAASNLTHSRFGALKVKDAIVDRFRAQTGRRPGVSTERPDVPIHVYLYRNRARVAIDLSGDALHRRGYRLEGAAAPLKENLAAAILLRADWPRLAQAGAALLDPMCGSGTLPIEAALIAADSAPGRLRPYWGFAGWFGHQPAIWRDLLDEAEERHQAGLARLGSIRGYDKDARAIASALANAERAGLAGHIHFERRELADCYPGRAGDRGLVVTNPPYGERLGDADLVALYTRLGDILRERFEGWQASVFTADSALGRRLGLRARRMHRLYNGPIDCTLLHIDVTPDAVVDGRPRALPPAERGEGAQMLANRLAKNQKRLERWLGRESIHCYRLYDADLPEYACAVDIYGDGRERYAHVQEYAAPASVDPKLAQRRRREALSVIPEALAMPRDRVYFKMRERQKGAAQYERVAAHGRFYEVREGPLRFIVNLEDYLDTGLFLDHRDIRSLIGELAAGKRFLNLFSYTGTASVYAAHGGAESTTTIDMSRTYLDWAERNLALNGYSGPRHALIQADCMGWLEGPVDEDYGLVFLDPPSFSTSKRMTGTLDVQRDHVWLIRQCMRRLARDGVLIFSNNLRRFKLDREALGEFDLRDITRATLPKDFERRPRIHQCWRIAWRG